MRSNSYHNDLPRKIRLEKKIGKIELRRAYTSCAHCISLSSRLGYSAFRVDIKAVGRDEAGMSDQAESSLMSAPAAPLRVTNAPAPLRGEVAVPGDKSISHRALMLAALAEGRSEISGLLEGEDVLRTASAMRALGAVIRQEKLRWVVEGNGLQGLREPQDVLDMGNSGTAARLLSGILSTQPFNSFMTGDASLRSRPMKRVIDPLQKNGACFLTRQGGRLPMAVIGTSHGAPIRYQLPVASAQVKSAILLAGLNAKGETSVDEPTPTRDHTENMLRYFGVDVAIKETNSGGRTIRVSGPARLQAQDVVVPGDPSSAAFPIVAALLIPGSELCIRNLGLNPLRTGLLTTLKEMGAQITIENIRQNGGESVGDLRILASHLQAVDVPAKRAPSMIDEYPILSVACAFARGTSRLRGLGELRVKESDRLNATLALLKVNKVAARIDGDDLIIEGRPEGVGLGGGHVATLMDHRLAMSAIIFGLAATNPIEVDDTGFIDTSFPGFIDLMNKMGAGL